MAATRINFSEWMPDQPGISGALTDAKNVVSLAIGYGPLPLPVNYSAEASEALTAVVSGKTPDGGTKLFASGATKIFDVSAVGALTDVSKSGGYSGSGRFRFTQFGNTIIGTNFAEKLQAYTLGTSTAFADLSASAPVAKYITVVRDFVVTAYVDDSGVKPTRVKWSAINDETDWVDSVTTQSDFQDIPDGGHIVGIRGGEFGLVFLEKSIHRMSYAGTPFIFQFDNISRGKGCIAEGSIAQYQGVCFFLSDDGFYMCDGQSVTPIGAEKVDRYFFKSADEFSFATMSAAVDPVRKLVQWNYKTTTGPNALLVYNFSTKKWTYGDSTVDYIYDSSTAGVTLEQLDSISTSIDALDVSLDSPSYIGGKYFLGGTRGNYVVTFTGQPKAGRLITGDIGDGVQSVITLAKPQIDNGSASVAVGSRQRLDAGVTFPAVVAADSENRVPLRANGKYHRIQVNPTGDNWTNAVAVDIEIVGQGVR